MNGLSLSSFVCVSVSFSVYVVWLYRLYTGELKGGELLSLAKIMCVCVQLSKQSKVPKLSNCGLVEEERRFVGLFCYE